MTEQREADRGLARSGFADHPEDLAACDLERHVADHGRTGRCDVDAQVGDRHRDIGRLDGPAGKLYRAWSAHADPRLRSMPAAVLAMPSPIRPVPMVSKAIAM